MTNGIVNIHGKDYMTVAKRLKLAQQDKTLKGIRTIIESHDPVVMHAIVQIGDEQYEATSSVPVDSIKAIEKQNPYEVAETSAVGRALGFAGYGLIESVASADEMVRATNGKGGSVTSRPASTIGTRNCAICGATAVEKQGTTKDGRDYHGIFCSTEDKTHTVWL